MESGIVNIRGREYRTVARRVSDFREQHPITDGWAILSEIVSVDAERVVMRASIAHAGQVVGVGYAEEVRASSTINKTSALENCETSAIGRALAACGFAGSEYASANEVEQAIETQGTMAQDMALRATEALAEGDWPTLIELNMDAGYQDAWRLLGSKVRSAIKECEKTRDAYRDRLKVAALHDDRAAVDELVKELTAREKSCVWASLGNDTKAQIKQMMEVAA